MSRDVITLACGADAYHALTEASHQKTRGGNDTVKVSQSALAALIRDHGAAIGKLRECGIETKDATE